jgi:hypothetical protein
MALTRAVQPPYAKQLGTISGGPSLPNAVALADAQTKIYAGCIVCINTSTLKAHEAADTANFRVIGRCEETVDNAATGESVTVRPGIYKYYNDTQTPVTKAYIGSAVYVADGETVTLTAGSVQKIIAGLCYDVDTDGCWVDMTIPGIAAAAGPRGFQGFQGYQGT